METTINTSQAVGGLSEATVTSSLLTEDINKKNNDSARGGGNALTVRGRNKGKEKVQEPRSKSKTHHGVKDLECYHCRSFKKWNKREKKGKKKAEVMERRKR